MKKVIAAVFLILSILSVGFAQDVRQITAEGVATVGSDPAAARDKAIEDALRRAVEQAVGTMVESETAVENYQLLSDKIYSQSRGYVKDYSITSEKQDGNMFRVTISAQVSAGDLNSDLSAIGLLHRRMKYPRVMVMIVETSVLNTSTYWNLYTLSGSQAEATVIKALKEKGFNVVDPNYQRKMVSPIEAHAAWEGDYDKAGHIGQKMGAEIVIVGQANSTKAANNIMGSDLLSVSTTITASAVKVGTNEVIAQATSDGTAAHINEVVALQQSLTKSGEKAADELISGILDTWQKETSGTRNLVVEVEDISQGELDKLKTALEKMRGVTEVIVRNYSSGEADMNIQSKSDAQDLAAIIGKTSMPGFRLVVIESSVDRLRYRVVH